MLQDKGTDQRQGGPNLLTVGLGQVTEQDLIASTRTYYVQTRVSATIGVAGGTTDATSIANRGSVLALLDEVILNEAGSVAGRLDARALGVFNEIAAPKDLSSRATRLTSADLGVGTYTIEESVYYNVALGALLRKSGEVSYVPKSAMARFFLQYRTVGAASVHDRLYVGGDRVVTVSALDAEVVQHHDNVSSKSAMPVFMSGYRQVANEVISGTVTDFEIELNTQYPVCALLVQQISGEIEVDDIITKISLIGPNRNPIPDRIAAATYADLVSRRFAGNLPAGYLPIVFVGGGNLSDMYNPAMNPRIRLRVDAAVSASAGTSSIRVWAWELYTRAGLTAPIPAAILAQ